MAFKNFKAKTVDKGVSCYYINIIIYLLHIQVHYPELFRILNQGPEFEYEVLIYRHREDQAKAYLKSLKELIKLYQQIHYSPLPYSLDFSPILLGNL